MAKAGVLYVGTADGVVRYSEPGGAGRWLRTGHDLRGAAVRALWASADSPLALIAATDSALLVSQDGGASWAPAEGVAPGLLLGSKADPAQVRCLSADGSVWASADGGLRWERAGALPAPASAAAASQRGIATLAAACGQQVYQSQDGGASWAPLGDPLPAPAAALAGVDARPVASVAGELWMFGQGGWAPLSAAPAGGAALAVLAGQRPVILAAQPGGSIAWSADDGASWELRAQELGWAAEPAAIATVPYHMDMAFAGAGAVVAVSADRGRSWAALRGELPAIQALAVARLA